MTTRSIPGVKTEPRMFAELIIHPLRWDDKTPHSLLWGVFVTNCQIKCNKTPDGVHQPIALRGTTIQFLDKHCDLFIRLFIQISSLRETLTNKTDGVLICSSLRKKKMRLSVYQGYRCRTASLAANCVTLPMTELTCGFLQTQVYRGLMGHHWSSHASPWEHRSPDEFCLDVPVDEVSHVRHGFWTEH